MGKVLTPGLDSVRQASNSTLIFATIISKLKRERKARKKFIHYLKKITYGPYNYFNRHNCDFRTYLFIHLKIRNEMKNYRLTYLKLDSEGIQQVIFTTILQSKSMRGAKQKAKNLEPFEWHAMNLRSLESEWNRKIDRIEFNY